MVNLFWLSNNAEESAKAYCDQHCFKIHSEIVEAAWDVVKALSPELYEKATTEGIDSRWRNHRHSQSLGRGHMHPLPRWMALCRANFSEALRRAAAIVNEHERRTGTRHACDGDLKWLLKHTRELNFQTSTWLLWYVNERLGETSKKVSYANWFDAYAYSTELKDGERQYVHEMFDRNICAPTHFPQIMEDESYPGCRTYENAVAAGRKHYIMKAGGVVDGKTSPLALKQPMRYFYSDPPVWLVRAGVTVQTQPKGGIKRKPSQLSDNPFADYSSKPAKAPKTTTNQRKRKANIHGFVIDDGGKKWEDMKRRFNQSGNLNDLVDNDEKKIGRIF